MSGFQRLTLRKRLRKVWPISVAFLLTNIQIFGTCVLKFEIYSHKFIKKTFEWDKHAFLKDICIWDKTHTFRKDIHLKKLEDSSSTFTVIVASFCLSLLTQFVASLLLNHFYSCFCFLFCFFFVSFFVFGVL